MAEGKHIPSTESKRRTVKNLLERYKRSEIPKKRDQSNPKHYADFWSARLSKLKLHQLTPAVIVQIRDELAAENSAATVNRHLALLSHACTMSEKEWGWMESNPLRRVRRLSEDNARVRFPTDDERDRLIETCEQSDYPHLLTSVLLALTTGARKGEILGLRWSDIDWNAQTAILHETKNKERCTLTLLPQVIDKLKKFS